MSRHKDANWELPGKVLTWDQAGVAVLLDLRDELKQLNRLLGCPNAVDIPNILRRIATNTAKKRKPKPKPKRRRA